MASSDPAPARRVGPRLIASVALAYWLLALLADRLSFPGAVSAIWPASGLAAAAALVHGYRILPAVLLGVWLNQMSWLLRELPDLALASLPGALLAHNLTGLSYAVGNCLEAALIVALLRRHRPVGNPLGDVRDVLRFIFLAALASPVLGALWGTLVTTGVWGWVPWSAFGATLWTWWVSAAAGILLIAPPLLSLHYERPRVDATGGRRLRELVTLLVATAFVLHAAFYLSYQLEYLLLPILLWAAFRFERTVTSCLGCAAMLLAVLATTQGLGPFAPGESAHAEDVARSLTLLQCFTATLMATALLVSTIVAEGRRAERALVRARDALETRVAERTHELETRSREAERANEAKSRFIAVASHDLRQPLHALGHFGEALSLALEQDAARPTTHQIARSMRCAVEDMREMFDAILDLSRLDAKVVNPECRPFDLDTVLERLERDFSALARAAGIDWCCRAGACRVHGDPLLLERILRNLLDNAFVHSDARRISLEARAVDSWIEIIVRDDGIGIPAERRQTVFDEFTQLEPARGGRRRHYGLGLGLAIVGRLCELLGHEIALDSALGKGTVFALRVPAAPPRIDDEGPPGALETAGDASLVAHVLLVDDAGFRDESFPTLLEGWGCTLERVPFDAPRGVDADARIVRASTLSRAGPSASGAFLETSRASLLIIDDEEGDADTVPGAGHHVMRIRYPVKPAQLRSALRAGLRRSTRPPVGAPPLSAADSPGPGPC